MTEYFKSEFVENAKKQRNRVLIFYFSVLFVFVALCVAALIWYVGLPYASPEILKVKLVIYPITAVFVIFSFLYLGIKFKRVRKYYALVKRISVGLKEKTTAEFLRYDDAVSTKDGVDMKSLIFYEWNKYKKEYFERKVLVFFEEDFPVLKEKTTYEFTTVGNVLYSYEEKEILS